MSAIHHLLEFPRFGLPGVNERMEKLTRNLDMVDTIKVVGSNGKGTTAHMLAEMAQREGLKTGLYTSPHILNMCERIKVNGRDIPVRDFNYILTWAIERAAALPGCGRFEVLALASLYHFSQSEVDLAVMEIGLGGRFDPVRIAPGRTSVLTSIDLEHTAILGDTFEAIAREKAAVCKAGDTLISGVSGLQNCVPDGVCYLEAATPELYPMQNNARLAATALAHHLDLPQLPDTFGVRMTGRLHKVAQDPPVYLDVAHTPAAIASVLSQFKERPVTMIYAGKADKRLGDIDMSLHHVIALQLSDDMAQASDILNAYSSALKEEARSFENALIRAKQSLAPNGVILCLGSFALVRTALSHFRGIDPDPLLSQAL